jgi:hypothetical protein
VSPRAPGTTEGVGHERGAHCWGTAPPPCARPSALPSRGQTARARRARDSGYRRSRPWCCGSVFGTRWTWCFGGEATFRVGQGHRQWPRPVVGNPQAADVLMTAGRLRRRVHTTIATAERLGCALARLMPRCGNQCHGQRQNDPHRPVPRSQCRGCLGDSVPSARRRSTSRASCRSGRPRAGSNASKRRLANTSSACLRIAQGSH